MDQQITLRNLLGGTLGGAAGILMAWYLQPAYIPMGVAIGVLLGWFNKAIFATAAGAKRRASGTADSMWLVLTDRLFPALARYSGLPASMGTWSAGAVRWVVGAIRWIVKAFIGSLVAIVLSPRTFWRWQAHPMHRITTVEFSVWLFSIVILPIALGAATIQHFGVTKDAGILFVFLAMCLGLGAMSVHQSNRERRAKEHTNNWHAKGHMKTPDNMSWRWQRLFSGGPWMLVKELPYSTFHGSPRGIEVQTAVGSAYIFRDKYVRPEDENGLKALNRLFFEYEQVSHQGWLKFTAITFAQHVRYTVGCAVFSGLFLTFFALMTCGFFVIMILSPVFYTAWAIHKLSKQGGYLLCLGTTLVVTTVSWVWFQEGIGSDLGAGFLALGTGLVSGIATELLRHAVEVFRTHTTFGRVFLESGSLFETGGGLVDLPSEGLFGKNRFARFVRAACFGKVAA